MNNNHTIGKKIKSLRLLKNITQAKLAEMAGIHEKHISKIELGIYKPGFETLEKILKALDINIETLIGNYEPIISKNNSFYIKSIQILNKANENELEYYYGLLKQAQKAEIIFSKTNI